ncbi:MAG: hypothetical protein LC104_17940 [Bacteroidales bacterium]|nr:hypothetical protein [Bacteroidales bacterium]
MTRNQLRRYQFRRWALAMMALGVTGSVGISQTPPGTLSPIDRAKAYTSILDQKAEADIRGTLSEVDRLAKIDKKQAIRRLREAIVTLDLSAQISSPKRAELVRLVQGRIDILEGRVPTNPGTGTTGIHPRLEKLRQQSTAITQAYGKEAREVAEAITEIEKLVDIGKLTAARSRVARLANTYPNNPSVIALMSQNDFGTSISEARQLAKRTGEAVRFAMNDVQESAIPARGNVEFPKNWAELTKAREEKSLIGPEEEAILRALEQPVKQPLNNAPFLETVQSLSNLVGKEIYLDKRSLEDAGLDLQRAVNMPGNVTARTALRTVLQSQGLTFVIKDKIIQVVTIEKARDLQVTRAYYMGDLIQMAGPFGGAVTWGPQIDYQQTMSNAQVVVDSIKQSVDPMIWKDRGGPGIVVFHYPSMSVIVRAPAEVHADLSGKRYKK